MKKINDIPGPQGLGIFSCIKGLITDHWNEQIRMHKRYGDIVLLKYPQKRIFVYHPEYIYQILKENSKNYRKGKGFEPLRILLGNGLVTSDGDTWKNSRRIVGNEFNSKSIIKLSNLMISDTNKLIQSWKVLCQQKKGPLEIDVNKEMMTLTFNIIGDSLFGSLLGEKSHIIQDNLGTATDIIIKRIMTGINTPSILPTPDNLKLSKINNNFEKIVYDIMEKDNLIEEELKEKKNNEEAPINVLYKLLKANKKEGKKALSIQQMRDEIMTLMLAGHETTSNLLTWTLYLLSKSPQKEQKLLEELNSFEKPILNYEDLKETPYLDAVIMESMRVLPPVPLTSRETIEEDEIGGYIIPSKTTIFMSQMITHNDPRFFNNPESFSPERFLNKDPYEENQGSYFPFVLGPRRCIGEEFSLVEAKIILSGLIKNFTFSLKENFKPKPVPSITLQAKNGMPMYIKVRS